MLTDETRPTTDPAPGADGARTDDTDASPPADSRTRGRRRWALLAIAVVVVLAAAVLTVWAVGDEGGDDEARDRGAIVTEPEPEPGTEPTPEATTGTASPDPGTADSATPAPTAPAPTTAEPVIEDGRHPVYLTAIDVAGRTVEFDLIQWLTGTEARDAWTAAHPDMPGDPPNDYFVVNDNPALRVLPVAPDVPVTVLEHGWAPADVTFEELPGFLAVDLVPEDGFLWHNPFWLTVTDGTVTAIEEQYTP